VGIHVHVERHFRLKILNKGEGVFGLLVFYPLCQRKKNRQRCNRNFFKQWVIARTFRSVLTPFLTATPFGLESIWRLDEISEIRDSAEGHGNGERKGALDTINKEGRKRTRENIGVRLEIYAHMKC
jgi:hypothetical protein